jgi:gluconate 5-dehydrogenase
MKGASTASVSDLYDLTNKVALVTGATGQLGQTICEALAEQGAHIIVNSRTKTDCIELADELSFEYQKAIGITGDVTKETEVQDIISGINDKFERLDILVNNAYNGEVASFEEMSVDQFRSALDGALVSTFLCTRESIPLLREKKGSIINIASIYGVVAPDHSIYGDSGLNNPANYGAAKAGVIQLTRWVATRYGKTGIRANAITPGGFYNAELEDRTDYTDEFVPNYEERTPLGRMGDPEDMKGPITFLSSDASQWVTGQNLIVDGGWTTW